MSDLRDSSGGLLALVITGPASLSPTASLKNPQPYILVPKPPLPTLRTTPTPTWGSCGEGLRARARHDHEGRCLGLAWQAAILLEGLVCFDRIQGLKFCSFVSGVC